MSKLERKGSLRLKVSQQKSLDNLVATLQSPSGGVVDNETLCAQLRETRGGTTALFQEMVLIKWKKLRAIEEIMLLIDEFGLIFLSGGKFLTQVHLLDLSSVITVQPEEVTLNVHTSDSPVTLHDHRTTTTNIGDRIARALIQAWHVSYPQSDRPFQVLIPDRRSSIMRLPVDDRILVCGGIAEAYRASCYSVPGFAAPREDFVDIFDLLHAQGSTKLRLSSFSNLDSVHLTALLVALQYNSYFTELSFQSDLGLYDRHRLLKFHENSSSNESALDFIQPSYTVDGPPFPSSGLQLSEAASAALVGVLGTNRKLVKILAPSIGLNADAINDLRDLLQATREGVFQLSVTWLDVSDNPIGDGLDALGEILSSIPYMPTALGLARLGPARRGKGILSVLGAFRRNTHTANNLTAITLSDNKFDLEATNALAMWLATPNSLQALGLAGTGIQIDKISDALARGCVSQLRRLDLSRNAIRSLAPLTLFIKASQSMQMLDLSFNPVQTDTLLDVIRAIIVNFSLFDFDLRLRSCSIDVEFAEILFGILSHNITRLDMSDNALGFQGLDVVGTGMAQNTCLVYLKLDRCFYSPKKSMRSFGSFAAFLRSNTVLQHLSLRADENTCLRLDLVPLLEAVGSNRTLKTLDISGHQAGDSAAVAIGRLLQMNKTLQSIEFDDNDFTFAGLEYVRDGVLINNSLSSISLPMNNIASISKTMKNKHAITALSRALESKVISNATKLTIAPSIVISPSPSSYSPSSSSPMIRERSLTSGAAIAAPGSRQRVTAYDNKFINVARQKDLDNLVHRIRCTGRAVTPENEKVFRDVAQQAEELVGVQTRHEAVMAQLAKDLEKMAEKLAQDATAAIVKAHTAQQADALNTIKNKYGSIAPDAQAELEKMMTTLCPPLSADVITRTAMDLTSNSWKRLEAEASRALLSTYSTFLYDTLNANLQNILNSMLSEAAKSMESSQPKLNSVTGSVRGRGMLERLATDDADVLAMLQEDDWDSSGDELEKIMASGDVDPDKMRHQLLFGFPVRVHNLEGKKAPRCQLYCDIDLKKIMWRKPYQKHQPKDAIDVSDITSIAVGIEKKSTFKDPKNLAANKCFSIVTDKFILDLEAPTSKQRAKWVFALQLLVGGLIKGPNDEEEDEDEEYEVINKEELNAEEEDAEEYDDEEYEEEYEEYEDDEEYEAPILTRDPSLALRPLPLPPSSKTQPEPEPARPLPQPPSDFKARALPVPPTDKVQAEPVVSTFISPSASQTPQKMAARSSAAFLSVDFASEGVISKQVQNLRGMFDNSPAPSSSSASTSKTSPVRSTFYAATPASKSNEPVKNEQQQQQQQPPPPPPPQQQQQSIVETKPAETSQTATTTSSSSSSKQSRAAARSSVAAAGPSTSTTSASASTTSVSTTASTAAASTVSTAASTAASVSSSSSATPSTSAKATSDEQPDTLSALPNAEPGMLSHINLSRPAGPKRRRPVNSTTFKKKSQESKENDDEDEQPKETSRPAGRRVGKPQAGGDITQEFLNKVKLRETSSLSASVRLTGDYVPAGPEHITRLFIIKGRRAIRPRVVECSYKSLNDGDAFVLDTKKTVFVWYGRNANKIERGAAAKFGTDYKNETRKGMCDLVYVEPHSSETIQKAFWAGLGVGAGEIRVAPEEQGGNDIVVENAVKASFALFKLVANADGSTLEMVRLNPPGKDLTKSMVEYGSTNVLALDAVTEVYTWEGKGALKAHREKAKEHVANLLKNRPEWTFSAAEKENQESLLFRVKFSDWPEPGKEAAMQSMLAYTKKKKTARNFDVSTMFVAAKDDGQKKKKADAGWFDSHELITVDKSDDGKGELQIWITNDKSKLVPVPESQHGQFFASECYVLQYVWVHKEKKRCTLYCWQGRSCNGNKKGGGMLLMQDMLETGKKSQLYYEDPEARRVVQSKEPEHFKRLFNSRLVYFMGAATETIDNQTSRLFHVKPRKGAPAHDAIAVQVELSSAGLNSRDVFIVLTSSTQFIWQGKGTVDEEKKLAQSLALTIKSGRQQVILEEGKENEAFWKALGGHEDYASADYLKDPTFKSTLFECSLASGDFTAERINPFSQDDLMVEYVYILDVFHEIYVWVGTSADTELTNFAMKVAVDYQKKASDNRPNDESSVLFVQPGAEPLMFTCHFLGWNGLAQLRNKQQQKLTIRQLIEQQEKKYPYKELIKRPAPAGLDVTCLESYLEDSEFQEVFQLTAMQFAKLPEWIRTNKKIEVGLY